MTSEQPRLCFLAMFDVLGFKALRARLGTAGLYQLYERSIQVGIQHSAAGAGRIERREDIDQLVPDFNDHSLSYRCISDSVIFFTRDADLGAFCQIVVAAHSLLRWGFIGTKAPLRGTIGFGDLIDDGPILIGSALEDAYSGESRQAWAGASLMPSCMAHVQASGIVAEYDGLIDASPPSAASDEAKLTAKRRLTRYQVPIKTGPNQYSTLDTLAIDWTNRMYEGAASTSFHVSEDPHAQTIAANTVAFEKWARSQASSSPSR